MGKKPGLPKKYAKFGFKRGWQMWRAAQRKRKTSGSTSTTTKRTSTGATKMPTSSTTKKPAKAMGAPRRRSRAIRFLSPTTITALTDGMTYASTAIGSTAAVHMAPVIKDQKNWMKILAQVATGVLLLNISRDRLMKKAAVGSFIGAGISTILPFLPEGMKIFGRRPFTSAELQKLQTLSYTPSKIGKPFSMGRPMPVSSAETLGRTSNRKSRFS